MTLKRCYVPVLLVAFCLSLGGKATAVEPINPLDPIKSLFVDVVVGESVGGAHRDFLFDGERERVDDFEASLEAEIGAKLRLEGYELDDDVDDFLGVEIGGHQQKTPAGETINVYFIEMTIVDFDLDNPCEDRRAFSQVARALGIASNDELEATLRLEVLRLLNENLP